MTVRPLRLPSALSGDRLWGGLLFLVLGTMVTLPIVALLYGSLRSEHPLNPEGEWTLDNYAKAITSPVLVETAMNTLAYALGSVVIALVFGTALAWIITRTNTPWRRAFEFLTLFLFLVPSLLFVVAWILLLSPGRGMINAVLQGTLGLAEAPFDIFTVPGMIWVQGLHLTPLAYLLVSGPLSSMDQTLEEASRMSGSGVLSTLRRVTLPMARPAILSAALLLLILCVESFEVPQLLGSRERVYTFPSLIFHQIREVVPADYGRGSAYATMLLVVSIIGVLVYRRATRQTSRYVAVKGKGYRVGVVDLGRWRWVSFALCLLFFGLVVILPAAILALGSVLRFFGRFDAAIFSRMTLENYDRLFGHPVLISGLTNSLILATVCAGICIVLGAAIGYILLRTRMRGGWLLEIVTMLPIAYPATVLALGLLWAYILLPLPIYGTVFILAIAYVTRFVPIGLRSVSGGLVQIDAELSEASSMSGASENLTFRKIILPLLKPSLIAGWFLLFMIMVRELSMSVLLSSTRSPVLSVVLFDYYTSGELGQVAAFSVLMLAIIFSIVAVARRAINTRYGLS